MIRLLAASLLLIGVSAPRTVYADGAWASFDRGSSCEAMSRAQRIVTDRSQQAHAGFAFDRAGARHGQYAARLSKPLRPGATVLLTVGGQPFLLAANAEFAWSRGPAQDLAIISAARTAPGMRIEARSTTGRFFDSYLLDGAPGAIDAAAACAARR